MTSNAIYFYLLDMNVSLTSHYEKMVENLIESGRFANASEVVRAGLSRLESEILLRTNFEKLVKASGGLGRDATEKESAEINRLIKSRRAKARK